MDKYSYLGNSDPKYIEDLYQQFLQNPTSIDEGWARFFEGFDFAKKDYSGEGIPEEFEKEFKVINLINAYRSRGHLFTKTNPVRTRRQYTPTLDIENFGLEPSNLKTVFQAGNEIGIGASTLEDIVAHLQKCYCQSIGSEFMYMRNPEKLEWVRDKIEELIKHKFSAEEKKHMLRKLNQAVGFEQFLHKKFVGQKRFSLEGGEALIPALDACVEHGAHLGVKEFIFGMAHRGRLNVLANIFNKPYEDIFNEFMGNEYEDNDFDGDVKYHLGHSRDITTGNGHRVHLSLAPNPSHLETVGPIVQGLSRAKIDGYIRDENQIVPVIIHGDAAIAGQGVVYEVVQMAKLAGYQTGGTVHIVINNQVGFTTNYIDGRSSTYCTDVAKVTLSPVFHVNGDDVEAVTRTMKLALEFRQQFKQDVFVDLLCYRRYGHNEGDEPKFTQPLLYKAIANHPNPRDIYFFKLKDEGVVKEEDLIAAENEFNDILNANFEGSKGRGVGVVTPFLNYTWRNHRRAKPGEMEKSPDTGVDKKTILALADSINTLPAGKQFIRKVEKLFEDRKTMVKEDRLDWALGELLAYATLLNDKYPVRLSGQDVQRGTFSHRHAVVKVEDSEEEYIPLNFLMKDQEAKFSVYNSLLSEYGVLGFEYGYAMASPRVLTIWEAQFGDFNNGAQIIMDQYLSGAEEKWKSQNGLVMLLPHGYEGMGAEHSSARVERFLILCAENNMQVCNITTPANLFHALRRQQLREFRKPLVVFTPKSLLRHPLCVSKVEEFTKGGFREVIDDAKADVAKIKTVAFTSGKIYYELIQNQQELEADDIAFVRLEQYYPLPEAQLNAVIKKYKNAKNYLWIQEEPENMGAWSYLLRKFRSVNLEVVARPSSGATATGSPKAHERQQKHIINTTFEYSKSSKNASAKGGTKPTLTKATAGKK